MLACSFQNLRSLPIDDPKNLSSVATCISVSVEDSLPDNVMTRRPMRSSLALLCVASNVWSSLAVCLQLAPDVPLNNSDRCSISHPTTHLETKVQGSTFGRSNPSACRTSTATSVTSSEPAFIASTYGSGSSASPAVGIRCNGISLPLKSNSLSRLASSCSQAECYVYWAMGIIVQSSLPSGPVRMMSNLLSSHL